MSCPVIPKSATCLADASFEHVAHAEFPSDLPNADEIGEGKHAIEGSLGRASARNNVRHTMSDNDVDLDADEFVHKFGGELDLPIFPSIFDFFQSSRGRADAEQMRWSNVFAAT